MVFVTVTARVHFSFENPISISIGTRVIPSGADAPASPLADAVGAGAVVGAGRGAGAVLEPAAPDLKSKMWRYAAHLRSLSSL